MTFPEKDFPAIIEKCLDSSDKNWEKAWDDFLTHYRPILNYYIKRNCLSWNIPRLNLQLEETVEDILSEVVLLLYKNLGKFKNKKSHQKFLSWMQIICSRTTSKYLTKSFRMILSSNDLCLFNDYKNVQKEETLWEMYERISSTLVNLLNYKKLYHRDIHIFLLHVWMGYSPSEINFHPCYSHLKLNVIEVIISRVRKKLTFF